jgi:hypothetical protein
LLVLSGAICTQRLSRISDAALPAGPTHPLENSASYIVREMRKGNRVWLPGEEVSRLRDLLGRPIATQGADQDQQLTKTLTLPLSRRGNQAVKTKL